MDIGERWKEVSRIFDQALERPGAERAAFVAAACGTDEGLRREVESLLGCDSDASDLLTTPAGDVMAKAMDVMAQAMAADASSLIGRQVGHYRIDARLGAGGMGEVYKATDTRLHRPVALKILPTHLRDPHLRQRFDQEAQAVAAVRHPHICVLHDIGQDGEIEFLVMEYLEGETLAERLTRGPLPVDEAFRCATDVADALVATHQQRITHRDLKPGNVMLTPSGAKLLDFGLATLRSAMSSTDIASVKSDSPATPAAVVGTPSYMAPEQLQGQESDHRTDVFAFGALTYEMVTGRKAFDGKSRSDLAAAIMTSEPAPMADDVPLAARRLEPLIRRCLAKDPNERWQNTSEIASELRQLASDAIGAGASVPAARARRATRTVLALAAVAALAVAALWRGWSASHVEETLHPVPFTSYLGSERNPSFSPDGDQVAFSWDGANQDNIDIYVKGVGQGQPRQLTNDPAADDNPAWSPGGSTIAFLRRSRPGSANVVTVSPLRGPEHVLGQVEDLGSSDQSMAWSPDGKWLAVADHPQSQAAGIWLFSVETGERRKLTESPSGTVDVNPAFSPDGRRLAFSRSNGENTGDVYLLSLERDLTPRGEPRRLTHDNRHALWKAWAPDGRELVFSAGDAPNSLWRISASGAGKPRPLTEPLDNGDFHVAISGRSHRLVFNRQTRELDIYRVELFSKGDHAHGARAFIASTRLDRFPSYSPDGEKIAFVSLRSGTWQLWICDGDGSNTIKLTSMESGEVASPSWHANGRLIYFYSNLEGDRHLYEIEAAGGKPRKLDAGVPQLAGNAGPVSPGPKSYYYVRSGLPPGTSSPGELMFCPAPAGDCTKVDGVENPSPYGFSISPDGRWLLYTKFVRWGSDLMLVENFK